MSTHLLLKVFHAHTNFIMRLVFTLFTIQATVACFLIKKGKRNPFFLLTLIRFPLFLCLSVSTCDFFDVLSTEILVFVAIIVQFFPPHSLMAVSVELSNVQQEHVFGNQFVMKEIWLTNVYKLLFLFTNNSLFLISLERKAGHHLNTGMCGLC